MSKNLKFGNHFSMKVDVNTINSPITKFVDGRENCSDLLNLFSLSFLFSAQFSFSQSLSLENCKLVDSPPHHPLPPL